MSGPDPLALEVRALRAELAEQRQALDDALRLMLAERDRRTAAALLPLLGELLVGDECFSAAGLAAAALAGRGSAWQAVRELLAPLADEDGGVRGVGRFLGRTQGCRFGGVRLVAAAPVRGVPHWRLHVSSR